jgi:transcriptional regulator with AAA-type ATPase domain
MRDVVASDFHASQRYRGRLMAFRPPLPRILIIDDLFGRTLGSRRNEERVNLCGQLLLKDVTDDGGAGDRPQVIRKPIAEVMFFRGQSPQSAALGDTVENDLDGCLRWIRAGWTEQPSDTPPWAMLLLDLCFYTGRVTRESAAAAAGMPEGRPGDDDRDGYFGLRILRAAREEFPDLPVVILSSKPREDVGRHISAAGALGFIPRGEPGSRELLQEYLQRHALIPDTDGQIVGCSVSLLKSLRAARRVASGRRHVLLQGEPGTGKELLAAYLHRSGPEPRSRPWVVVDSGTLSAELFATELFGHVRGAFTGATTDRVGRIVQADGGDLFLDEIGNMPLDVQAGLLRVLQDGVVTPVGAERGQRAQVRVLSATNEDVEGRAIVGDFRTDLLERLRLGGTIPLLALRDRRDDIPLLATHFLAEALRENPRSMVREISQEAMEMLQASDWPGNIRALESSVRKAVNSHPDVDYLFPHHFDDLSGSLKGRPGLSVVVRRGPGQAPAREAGRTEAPRIAAVLELLDDPAFAELQGPGVAGVLPRIEGAYARLIARLLRSALMATARATPDQPEGKVLIHPAIKLLQGDPGLSASKAADVVKRLLSLNPQSLGPLVDDGFVKAARKRALTLRPRNAKKAGATKPETS